jgi:hypothetical protein
MTADEKAIGERQQIKKPGKGAREVPDQNQIIKVAQNGNHKDR